MFLERPFRSEGQYYIMILNKMYKTHELRPCLFVAGTDQLSLAAHGTWLWLVCQQLYRGFIK